jgi:hypothetical protein
VTVLLILALWVAVSALLAALWAGYRCFVGTYGMEDFDVPREWHPRAHRLPVR